MFRTGKALSRPTQSLRNRQVQVEHAAAGGDVSSASAGCGPLRLIECFHLSRVSPRRLCEWLLNHLPEEINLDDIASTFALSRSLLTRSFRRHTGTSIVEYLNTRRLERAAVLLTSAADESIARAAMDCGFSNLSHFHRCFKSAYGLTPAEFRRNFSER